MRVSALTPQRNLVSLACSLREGFSSTASLVGRAIDLVSESLDTGKDDL
jgi:hypothetical protein